VHDFPDGAAVATYLVIGDPPVLVGLVHVTVAAALADTAWTERGVVGLLEEP
jgi:hypothetical protein